MGFLFSSIDILVMISLDIYVKSFGRRSHRNAMIQIMRSENKS